MGVNSMSLKYKCPSCGTALGYKGLCFRCKSLQDRLDTLALGDDEIHKLQQRLIANIKALDEFEDPYYTDFLRLHGYLDAITDDIKRAALKAQIYRPSELYYHAPDDVRDGLIEALYATDDSYKAAELMSALAMQGDDKALQTLLDLQKNPRPWQNNLYVPPSSYAQIGGWSFDDKGQRIKLNYDVCYAFEPGDHKDTGAVIGTIRDDICPHCGGHMVDMLRLDASDKRFEFLGMQGIITATCCPNCVGFLKEPAYNRFYPDGSVDIFASSLFDGAKSIKCYITDKEYQKLQNNKFILNNRSVPLFYGTAADDLNTIGGFGNFIQDAEYVNCPMCNSPMKYLAQIQWDTLFDYAEGTLYIEICPKCHLAAMLHQQT